MTTEKTKPNIKGPARGKHSAGILLFRRTTGQTEVLLIHPGGPFWAKKDLGAWSIPKGEYSAAENSLDAARREFKEETGADVDGNFIHLGEIRLAGGKRVSAWALEGDLDASGIQSNSFQMEWPPRSGRFQTFPEADRAVWFTLVVARTKLLSSQVEFLDRLLSSPDFR